MQCRKDEKGENGGEISITKYFIKITKLHALEWINSS
jgi:hypothetical protein